MAQFTTIKHRRRLAVKPGITYSMQVSGRGKLSLISGVQLELAYIDHYSLGATPLDFAANDSGG
ncbi:MAG: sugar transferase [Ardenticatenaceae bacterium]|nr:sugar transferase [Ardenticatenaceae bacterium]